MTYQIITKTLLADLSIQVNSELSKGWELYGLPFEFCGSISQAMILKQS